MKLPVPYVAFSTENGGFDDIGRLTVMGTIPQEVMLETIRQFGHHIISHFRAQEPAAVPA